MIRRKNPFSMLTGISFRLHESCPKFAS